MNWKLQLGKI